jgi:hypothetical protein
MKKVLLIVSVFMVFIPVISIAQAMDSEACMQAEADAEMDVNKTMWFAGGCLIGILAVGAAYLVKPNPPASQLVGKSPEYIASYSDCYKEKASSIQTSSSMYGCIVGTVISAAIYTIVLLSLEE